jgi:type VI protein secretion system component VasK
VKRGSGYAAQTGGEIEGNPAYADYLTRLARVSNGLFNEDGKLEIAFSLRMQTTAAIPQITVNFEGRQWTFTQTSAASQNFLWTGASLPTRISVVVGNRTEPILDLLPSPWWIFHALSEAQVEERGPDQYNVTWRRNAISVTGELTLVEPSAIFHSNTLSGVSNCNISVAR